MRKHFIVALFVAIFALPAFASAATVEELLAQIQALTQQINALQAQISQQTAIPRWCHTFNSNLKIDNQGNEINALQTALEKEGFNVDDNEQKSEAVFGESTASAVSSFQDRYRNEILTPSGLSAPTGYVGPATRRKLNQLYGCGSITPTPVPIPTPTPIPIPTPTPVPIPPIPIPIPPSLNQPPTISGVSGPTTLQTNQTGTWTVRASDPESGSLTYSVLWGDESPSAGTSFAPQSQTVYQSATFTHSYAKPGYYYSTFTVSDNGGLSAKTSISVNVGGSVVVPPPNQPSITVSAPAGVAGGMDITSGTTYSIRWIATSVSKVMLSLCSYSDSCMKLSGIPDAGIDASLGVYNWYVDPNHPYFPGDNLRIKISDVINSNVYGYSGYFSVVISPPNQSSIAVISPNGGRKVGDWTDIQN